MLEVLIEPVCGAPRRLKTLRGMVLVSRERICFQDACLDPQTGSALELAVRNERLDILGRFSYLTTMHKPCPTSSAL